jgi:hypothetical protein
MRRRSYLSIALASGFFAGAPAGGASALTVDIAAGPSGWGCTTCSSVGGLSQGLMVTLDNEGEPGPLQYTLGPGTYTITNGATSGAYSAYQFTGGGGWAWNFVIGADNGDNTATVLDAGYASGVWLSQAQAAAATGIQTFSFNKVLSGTSVAGYTDTLTLAKTTKLDFFVVDYFLFDNAGGVSLDLEPATPAVPEPSTWAMMLIGFAWLGLAGYRRSRRAVAVG